VKATHLADKSALARFPITAVEERLRPLLDSGLLATCAVVDLEILYSARDLNDYEVTRERRRALDDAPITPEVTALAIGLQHALARRGQHRLPIPDLLISAAAKVAGLTVLHYDADFDRLASVGGARSEWVVPQGSI
jgi:hypothetical protein